MARLEIRKLKRVSRVEIAQQQQPIKIGRSSRNDVVLRDERVSRDHCVIEIENGCARVRDFGSRTGTFINNTRITEAILHHHDRISIGPFVLVFRDSEGMFTSQTENPTVSAANEPITNDEQQPASAELEKLASAEQLMAQQTAQIAELTSTAASLHSQLMEKTEQVASLQREVESLVQRQRNAEATRQTTLDRIERTERKLTDLITQMRSLDEAACRLANVQQQLAEAERAWADADERAARNDASEEALEKRNQASTMLDRLNRQRDEAILQLQKAIADVRQSAQHAPARSATPDHEIESKPPTSSRRWWRFGARRHV